MSYWLFLWRILMRTVTLCWMIQGHSLNLSGPLFIISKTRVVKAPTSGILQTGPGVFSVLLNSQLLLYFLIPFLPCPPAPLSSVEAAKKGIVHPGFVLMSPRGTCLDHVHFLLSIHCPARGPAPGSRLTHTSHLTPTLGTSLADL